MKLIVVGDDFKTQKLKLVKNLAKAGKPEFQTLLSSTFDCDEVSILIDGKMQTVYIYNTVGYEGHDRLRPLQYPNTDVVIITFSQQDKASFENISGKWYPEIVHHLSNVPVLIVGTHDGQANKDNEIELSEVEKLAKKLGIPFKCCTLQKPNEINEVLETACKLAVAAENQKKKGSASDAANPVAKGVSNFFSNLFKTDDSEQKVQISEPKFVNHALDAPASDAVNPVTKGIANFFSKLGKTDDSENKVKISDPKFVRHATYAPKTSVEVKKPSQLIAPLQNMKAAVQTDAGKDEKKRKSFDLKELAEEYLNDPLTLGPMYYAVSDSKGHTFAKSEELLEWFEKKHTCPTCKQPWADKFKDEFKPNFVVRSIIDKLIEKKIIEAAPLEPKSPEELEENSLKP